MNILLSGATGLIGRCLGPALVKQGHKLVVLVRKKNAELGFSADTIEFANGKLPEHPWFGQVECFIHLAGAGISDQRWTESRKKELRDSRIKTAEVVVNKLKAS